MVARIKEWREKCRQASISCFNNTHSSFKALFIECSQGKYCKCKCFFFCFHAETDKEESRSFNTETRTYGKYEEKNLVLTEPIFKLYLSRLSRCRIAPQSILFIILKNVS